MLEFLVADAPHGLVIHGVSFAAVRVLFYYVILHTAMWREIGDYTSIEEACGSGSADGR